MQVFNIFNALGTIAFAYGGHNVVRNTDVLSCLSAHQQLSNFSHRDSSPSIVSGRISCRTLQAIDSGTESGA